MLTASGLSKAHGARVLFSDVTLQLSKGRKVALIGGNGVGKTTLIEILAGRQVADTGSVTKPKDLEVGYLPQDLAETATGTVLEETMAGAGPIADLADELHHLEAQLSDPNVDDMDTVIEKYGEVQSRFEQLGGYAIESEAHRVLAGLGFRPSDSSRPVKELSGGWRMRVALAQLLLADPDLLILDEPTNHLDVDSVAWLEQHLSAWTGSLLFVSHDRDFIDAVAERIIEISSSKATEYVGGFAEFVVQREERLEAIRAAAANQARQMKATEQFIDRFRYKATKARQVQSRIKTLEKLDRIEVPTEKELAARFQFPEPQRSSRIVAELRDVEVGFDGTAVLSDVDMVIERGQKIALVGPNGAGKTTLIRLLTGDLQPQQGTVTIGNNVDISSFAQNQTEVLVDTRTVFEEFNQAVGKQAGNRNLRSVLGSFGFSGDAADRRVGELSGGERTRLALAKTMVLPVNLLVLDEPTNHLDLPSCDVLQDALQTYPGTVLLVTHDRYLIRSVADILIEVRDGLAIWHDGVDEHVLNPTTPAEPDQPAPQRALKKAAAPKVAPKQRSGGQAKAAKKSGGGGALRELQKAATKVERKWEAAEANVAELQLRLADPAVYDDQDKVAELVEALNAAKDTAAELMNEWESAMRRVERAEA